MKPGKYGYRLCDDSKRLLPVPEEQAVIALIRDLHDAGMNFATAVEELNRRGLRTRLGPEWKKHSAGSVVRVH